MIRNRVIQFHPLLLLLLIGSYFLGLFLEMIAFFVIIIIHELGHFLTAKYFKWNITRLMIWPFGGVMETDDFYNRSSSEEFWVVIAGPLQHIWIYVVLLIMDSYQYEHVLLDQLWMVNSVILLFNLLPILPLDGGRILFIGISKIVPFQQAIIWMSVGSIAIIAFINVGLYFFAWTSIHLTFLSIFLLLDNWLLFKNKHILLLKHLLGRYFRTENKELSIELIRVKSEMPIGEIVKHFKRDRYHYIYVGQEDKPIPEEECLKLLFTENKPERLLSKVYAKDA